MHHCHWPGCCVEVPPKLWGCLPHWRALPPALRSRIWRDYRPGQEVTKTPSPAYLYTARLVQLWCKEKTKFPALTWPVFFTAMRGAGLPLDAELVDE